MPVVCILGAGALGGAVAHALARGEAVRRIRLIDERGAVAAGTALDIQQAGAVDGAHARLDGTDDPARLVGCDVVVVADAPGDGDDPLPFLRHLAAHAGRAPIVFAGPAHDALLLRAARDVGLPRTRLLGSAPEALTAAARALVALEAGCSPSEVSLGLLGAPPRGVAIPWSEASIGGYAAPRVLSLVQLRRLESRLDALWPPGPFALGLAAARLVGGIVRTSRRAFSVLTVLDGEFGVRHRTGILPAAVSAAGIVHVRVPTLDARERVLVDNALG